jgi:hypothetical protein
MEKNSKYSEMVIIESTAYSGALSMRGKGHSKVRKAIKEGGFEPGDKVVIITKEQYDSLCQDKNNEN